MAVVPVRLFADDRDLLCTDEVLLDAADGEFQFGAVVRAGDVEPDELHTFVFLCNAASQSRSRLALPSTAAILRSCVPR